MSSYHQQDRGDAGAYARYLEGMDASMRQKVALTAAHLLDRGVVADMGMGSGSGSFALASLYPGLEVVGVDINPTMVEMAQERYQLPNLSFRVGDIAEPCFGPDGLTAIFDSSVLHHVTSFNDYEVERAAAALAQQARQLGPYGTLIVRDFVRPEPGRVRLRLEPHQAELLERFASEFRNLWPPERRGFDYQRVDGWFELDSQTAVEFLLRKDYVSDWETENLEEYTYFTQARFEQEFARLGLRVLASNPIWNPWIIRHRFEGQFEWTDEAGRPLDYPPTNYVIVGEKVPPGEGVGFRARSGADPLGFLKLSHFRDRRNGHLRDLVSRPHPTIDILPFYREGDELFVLARRSYPRPIPTAEPDNLLNCAARVGYFSEPLTAIQTDQPLGQTAEELLATWADIGPEQILACWEGAHYFPSPGGIQEEVRSLLVEISGPPDFRPNPDLTPFSTAGLLRSMEATQLLRAGQVGGLQEARLETNTYLLLARLGREPGPWIGEALELRPCGPLVPASLHDLEARGKRRCFVPTDTSASFLEVARARFEELDAGGAVVGSQVLEFVRPRQLSLNTLVVAPLACWEGNVYFGVDDDDLPACQAFLGNSQLLVAPAWRL
ncbi:MAG: methyltransferase domain-containing protein, partial [Candidatus Eremiobacteraeota bacterium]|nr:methyltransferase domain-containing protein [Candidatus Eremiobacteraeota bacterium]